MINPHNKHSRLSSILEVLLVLTLEARETSESSRTSEGKGTIPKKVPKKSLNKKFEGTTSRNLVRVIRKWVVLEVLEGKVAKRNWINEILAF